MLGFAPIAGTPIAAAFEPIHASLTQTQADQTLSSAATVLVTGSVVQTQAAQTLASVGTVLVTGSVVQTQADQTLLSSGTAPIPADTPRPGGGGDEQRRKWLEWAAARKRGHRRGQSRKIPPTELSYPPAVVELAPVAVPPPILILPISRETQLLQANLAAVRAAQQDRLAVTVADLSAAVRWAREQDEEDAAMLLLLG